MRFLLFAAVVGALVPDTMAQNSVEWAVQLPHAPNAGFLMEHTSMAISPSSEIAVFGVLGNATSFGVQQYGNLEFTVYDSSGAVITSSQYQGSGAISEMVSHGGDYYVVGQFRDSLDFPGVVMLNLTGQADPRGGFVGKFDMNGQAIWVKDLTTISNGLNGNSLSVGNNGDIYVGTNSTFGFGGGAIASILRLDNNGLLLDNWPMYGVGAIASVSTNSNGMVGFSGSCTADSLNLNGQATTAINDYNQLYGLFDSTGTLMWVESVLDVTCVFPSIHLDDSDNLYFSADSHILAHLDSIPILPSNWVFAFYVAKVNSSGVAEWVYQSEQDSVISGDSERSFERKIGNKNEGVRINGRTRGIVDWGNGVISGVSMPGSDLFTLEIDANGNPTKALSTGLSAWSKKNITSIQSPSGTHTYMLTANMDTLRLPGINIAVSGMNIFLSKWNNSVTSITDRSPKLFRHFPDPATDLIRLDGAAQNAQVHFHDISGRLVLTTNARNGVVLVDQLKKGTYVMHWLNGSKSVYRSTVRIVR